MWLIVVNAKSGKGKAGKLSNQLIKLMQKDRQIYKVIKTDSASDTKRLVEQELETNKYQYLVAVGGDGLVNLCLQYVACKPIALTVIPAGTGNDFARAVGTYQKSLTEIYHAIKSLNVDYIDLGKISGSFGERWYVQVLSTGFDALVNKLANRISWPRGQIKYTLATIFTLSIIVELIPKIQLSSTHTKPAIATLGDKKQCELIVVSCEMLHPIFKIVLALITAFASMIQPG